MASFAGRSDLHVRQRPCGGGWCRKGFEETIKACGAVCEENKQHVSDVWRNASRRAKPSLVHIKTAYRAAPKPSSPSLPASTIPHQDWAIATKGCRRTSSARYIGSDRNNIKGVEDQNTIGQIETMRRLHRSLPTTIITKPSTVVRSADGERCDRVRRKFPGKKP